MKKKIVWQADAFELVASAGRRTERIPTAMVFDPHEPYFLVSRVFPESYTEAMCLKSAVEEALFTYGVKPDQVEVRWGKEKALEGLAARTGFGLVLRENLEELAAVKADFGRYAKNALAILGA